LGSEHGYASGAGRSPQSRTQKQISLATKDLENNIPGGNGIQMSRFIIGQEGMLGPLRKSCTLRPLTRAHGRLETRRRRRTQRGLFLDELCCDNIPPAADRFRARVPLGGLHTCRGPGSGETGRIPLRSGRLVGDSENGDMRGSCPAALYESRVIRPEVRHALRGRPIEKVAPLRVDPVGAPPD
jgi:hypothetical protein